MDFSLGGKHARLPIFRAIPGGENVSKAEGPHEHFPQRRSVPPSSYATVGMIDNSFILLSQALFSSFYHQKQEKKENTTLLLNIDISLLIYSHGTQGQLLRNISKTLDLFQGKFCLESQLSEKHQSDV